MRTASTTSLGLLLLTACPQDYEINPDYPDVDPGDVTDCGFTPISGTRMSVYDCNPVFESSGEGWAAQVDAVGFRTTEVLGHPFYQIWYSAGPSGVDYGNWGLGYAVSSNGTEWEAHDANPLLQTEPGAWDQDAMDAIQVEWDPDTEQYILAYQGFNLDRSTWGLGVATSFDGVAWNKLPSNPVIDFSGGDYFSISYCWPLAIHGRGGGTFDGYIAGQPDIFTNVCQIYPVTATSPASWNPSTTPALVAGPDAYDRSGMTSAAVVEYGDTWYMFYVGFEEWEIHTGYQSSKYHSLALARSPDGVTWSKSGNNPLPINNHPDQLVSAVAAQVVGSRIHLWVTDHYESLGTHAVGYYYYEPDIEPHP